MSAVRTTLSAYAIDKTPARGNNTLMRWHRDLFQFMWKLRSRPRGQTMRLPRKSSHSSRRVERQRVVGRGAKPRRVPESRHPRQPTHDPEIYPLHTGFRFSAPTGHLPEALPISIVYPSRRLLGRAKRQLIEQLILYAHGTGRKPGNGEKETNVTGRQTADSNSAASCLVLEDFLVPYLSRDLTIAGQKELQRAAVQLP